MLKFVQGLLSSVKVVEQRDAPGADELVSSLTSRDFDALDRALSERQEHDLRLWRIDSLASKLALRPRLAEWRAAAPNSHHAALVGGFSQVHWAWQIRGSGWEPRQHAEFQSRLSQAEATLFGCMSSNQRDPAPHYAMLAVARGLEQGAPAVLGHLKEAARRAGPSYRIGQEAVQSLAPKWGGDASTLTKVVEELAASAPAGHVLHALRAEAATELVLIQCMRQNRFEPGLFTYGDPARLVALAESAWHKSPARKPHIADVFAHSALGFAHWCSGNTSLAEPHLRAIHPVYDALPWGMSGDAASTARAAAKACGL